MRVSLIEKGTAMRKQSKRVAITKESIEVAYLELLEEKTEGKITVKEVCERAKVNRTTFYKYYEDAEALSKLTREHVLDCVENLLKETIPDNHSDTFEFISQIIMVINRDNRIRKITLLFHENDFRQQLEELIWKYYYKYKYGSNLSEEEWIITTYAKHGLMGLLESWIEEGMTISSEKLANQMIMIAQRIRGVK